MMPDHLADGLLVVLLVRVFGRDALVALGHALLRGVLPDEPESGWRRHRLGARAGKRERGGQG
ncbi:hypothetical protein ACFPP6_29205 [Streptomyces aureoversilis]|uniref:Uncharacterized protein n=2 Tax=Streptomyces aureoversilis TaxID=67277 RepID=A0ABW0A519_9ACTN